MVKSVDGLTCSIANQDVVICNKANVRFCFFIVKATRYKRNRFLQLYVTFDALIVTI